MCVKDPFHKLIPFWQIQIYADKIGYKDFYADLMEHLRNQPHKGAGNASIIICMNILSFAVISWKQILRTFSMRGGSFRPENSR